MTSRNTISTSVTDGPGPFLLSPAGKDYLWGGSRLNDDFSKNIPMEPLAETWECSTHPDGISTVASGEYKGLLLTEVLKLHPEYLGSHPQTRTELPILIKLIDAKQNLSIQVHPEAAGKMEMWYVLDAKRDTRLYYGLHHDLTRATLKTSLEDGTVEKYLQKVPVRKDDVFSVPAGQIHAIGAGALIASVQEYPNPTYRLYDYRRADKTGVVRPLQTEQGLDSAILTSVSEPRQPLRVLRFTHGMASELLFRCAHFQVERVLLNTERYRDMGTLKTAGNSFQVLLCTDGCGVLQWAGERSLSFFKGDCVFIPANSTEIKLHGQGQLLKVSC